MRRKTAREIAMQLIFQMLIQDDYSNEMIAKLLQKISEENEQLPYIKNVVLRFTQNMQEIDSLIEVNSPDWKLNRMAKVDLAILRVAVTEILYLDDIPESVSINEAVEIAKKFSTEESGSFINGILGSIVEKK
jgi:N utilization substance protein B